MTFDFRQIEGAENSKAENFSSLCTRLVMRHDPMAKPIDGRGGDQGVDTFVGIFNGECRVFEHKYFVDRVGQVQRRQIEKSLRTAVANHQPIEWTLMLPVDLNPSEIIWFEKLKEKYHPLPLDWWGKTKLQDLLGQFPDIARDFQPPPNVMVVLAKGGRDFQELDASEATAVIAPIIQRLTGATPPSEVMNGIAQEILSQSKLHLLIWGPGPSFAELHRKRCEIRDSLRRLGHTAHFSEEISTPELLSAGGLNLTVAERIQVEAYDYIVCLMASPGSIAEVHDFAKNARLAAKMMICVDQAHQSGYSAEGALKIFEGNNGRLDWFNTPTDLDDCHLATRVLGQVSNVFQAKQWKIAEGLS